VKIRSVVFYVAANRQTNTQT